MSALAVGRIGWDLKRDRDGHRDYMLKMLVETTDSEDGPGIVYFAGGLPNIGAPWIFGNEDDPWAFCSPEAKVTPVVTPDPNKFWVVDIPFTTKPFKRCQDTAVGDPLQEPDGIGGSFVSYVMKLRRRANNNSLIKSSSHELIDDLERDAARPTVKISQNVPNLELGLFASMIHTTNDNPLWGLGAGKIKLDNVSWERKVYGSCFFYYTRSLDFSIKYEGFDIIDVLDTGFKEFDDDWYLGTDAERADPMKYRLIRSANRGDSSPTRMPLDGLGNVLTNVNSPVFLDPIQVYGESNFLLLNIPISF